MGFERVLESNASRCLDYVACEDERVQVEVRLQSGRMMRVRKKQKETKQR